MQKDIERLKPEKFANFDKAQQFFFRKELDSAFVYSSQAYQNISQEEALYPYLNYIYGASALGKNFLSLGKGKLENIPQDFKYRFLVDSNLGNIALDKNEFSKALNYFNLSLSSGKIKSKRRLKILYHNIGTTCVFLKKYNLAENYLKKELAIAKEEKDTLSMIYSRMELANLFYEQYKDEIAIAYFEDAYTLASLYKDFKVKQQTTFNLAVVEKNRKNYQKSTEYYTEHIQWKDSVWNRDKISQLLEKDKQIALLTKDNEIALQKQETAKQKERIKLFTIVLLVISVFLGLLFYLYQTKKKQNKLIHAQKDALESLNATKNYLLSVISHDLRTPIKTINSSLKKTTLLLNENKLKEAQKVTQENEIVSERTSILLNNILNWALQQNDQLLFVPEVHLIDVLVAATISDFNAIAATKNIQIETDFETSDQCVFIDKELFKIAFRNLIDNAIKYTFEGGLVTIKTRYESDKCILSITDTGKGMSDSILNLINNYDTLTVEKVDRSKGVGLGLVLSKTLIIKNNGIFTIQNNTDKGITITIQLPTKVV